MLFILDDMVEYTVARALDHMNINLGDVNRWQGL